MFTILQSRLHFIGINHPKEELSHSTLWKNSLIFSLIFGMFVSSFYFISFSEKTFSEFAEAFHLLMTMALNSFTYILFVRKRSTYYGLIENANKMCQERKMKIILVSIIKKIISWKTPLKFNSLFPNLSCLRHEKHRINQNISRFK